MPLHSKKHYDQRRWLMEQPFEKQEKAQRRLDYFFFAIAVAVVVAMFFTLFKSHNIGRTVLFFLFLIWWTYFALKSDLHRIAKKICRHVSLQYLPKGCNLWTFLRHNT